MIMGAVDLRDVDWVLTNRITEWHREHYLCSTTGALAKEQGSQPLRTEFGFLQGAHHIKVHEDYPLHPLRVRAWQIAAMHPGNQGLAVFGIQRQVVRGLLHLASFATETPLDTPPGKR